MTILEGLVKHLSDYERSPLERVYKAYSFLKNSVVFKILNITTDSNKREIRISSDLSLKIHDKAYYAFRYFTDFSDEMVEELRSFMILTKSYKCFIDVGSHYGIFSLAFSRSPGSIAYALEPSPEAFEVLKANIMKNPNHCVKPYSFAASSSNEKINMYADTADHFIALSKGGSCISVDAIKLDTFIAEQQIKPDVIKIDVEGYELSVLKGANQLISSYSPLIFLEIHPNEIKDNGGTVKQIVNYLHDLGYEFSNHRDRNIDISRLMKITQTTRVVCRPRILK